MLKKMMISGATLGAMAIMASPAAAQCQQGPGGIPVGPKGADFANLEAACPVTDEMLANITPESLGQWSQEALDQLYARLKSGPVPNGKFDGTVIFADGGPKDFMAALASKIHGRDLSNQFSEFGRVAEAIWKGKHFYRADGRKWGYLKNFIVGETLPLLRTLAHSEQSQRNLARLIERHQGQDTVEIFPAKVHCGQSLFDSRRESVIIDYAFGDDPPIPGINADGYEYDYIEGVDSLAGRKGLQVRDEVRMIRPGLYLGRAYMAKVFVLNFVLQLQEGAQPESGQDCWVGTQVARN